MVVKFCILRIMFKCEMQPNTDSVAYKITYFILVIIPDGVLIVSSIITH